MLEIKIFGERNTGTNYLEELVKLNLDARILPGSVLKVPVFYRFEFFKNAFFFFTRKTNLGWKHSYINPSLIESRIGNSKNLLIICVVKNPYSFLLSLYKRPYHNQSMKNLSFQKFLSSEWVTVARENVEKKINSPVALWNIKTESYFNAQKKVPNNLLIVKYEDLVENPEKVILQIAEKLGVKLEKEFVNYLKSTKKDQKSFNDYSKYYLQELWKKDLKPSDITEINQRLDVELVSKLNYNILSENN